MATLEEVEAELSRREQLKAVEAELARRAPAPAPEPAPAAEPVAPVPPPRGEAVEFPAFAPPTAAQTEEDVQRLIDEEMELRGATLTPAQRERARRISEQRFRRELAAEYGDVLTQAAPPEAQEAFRTRTPAFRPTQVTYTPAYRTAQEVIEQEGPVSPEVLDLEMARFPTPLAEAERKAVVPQIYDRERGSYRFPTALEELREAYARQPRMTEAEAQARGAAIKADPDEAFPLQGVITERLGGRGTFETELGAALRGPLGTLSATLADAYFRGLGYEVATDAEGKPILDAEGNPKPKDINDFGYKVAEVRRAVGLPETVAFGLKAGLTPMPLPGVATDPSILTEYDPTGVRAPSPEPETARRLARHVASGRSMGDEFAQSPTVRKAYADLYGDPDAAFWGGTLLDVYMPTGIGAIAKGGATAAKVLGKGAPKTARYLLELAARGMETEAAESVLRHVRRSGAVQDSRTAGGLPQAVVDAVLPSPQRLRAAARQADVLDAVIDPQGPSDPRLMRAVAERLVPTLGLEADREARAITAIRNSSATTGATLVDEVGEVLELAPGSPQAQAYARAVDLRTPADLVLVTPRTAVPRAIAEDVRAATRDEVRRVFEGTPVSEREPESLRELIEAQADALARWASGEEAPVLRLSNEELAARLAETPLADRYPGNLFRVIERDGVDALPGDVQRRIVEDYADLIARQRTRAIVEDHAMGAHVTLTPRERALLERSLTALGEQQGVEDVPKFVARTIADAPKADSDDSLVAYLAQGAARDIVAAREAADAGDLAEAARLQRRVGETITASQDLQARADRARTAAAGLNWRDANEVSDAQVYLDELADRSLFDSPTLRRVVSVYGDPNQPYYRASVTELQREVQTIGQGVLRRLGQDLTARVEGTGPYEGNPRTYEEALDSLLVDALEDVPDADPDGVWAAILGEMYDPSRVEKVLRDKVGRIIVDSNGGLRVVDEVKAGDRLVTDSLPTLQRLRQLDTLLAGAGDVPRGRPPSFDRAMLKMVVEEGVRKNLGRSARQRAAQRFGAPDVEALPGQVSVPFDEADALRNPRFAEYAWTIDRANNPEEVALLQEIDSAVRLFDDVEVRQRGNVANLASYYGDKVARGARDALHSLNYGVSVIPNPLTATSRAGVSSILMLSQMGAQRALEAAGRSVSRANPLAARRVGRGITAVDGRTYSPAELDELWQQSGGAVTAIDAARRGSLAEDILLDAKRASERVHGKGSTDRGRLRKVYDLATSRGYWQSQAEAAELSFRRSVFELALADGASPAEAGELARTAVIDYAGATQALDTIAGAIPGADGLPKYFASAAEDAALAREAVKTLARNPKAVRAVVQAQRAQQRAFDPEQLYGDAGLKSLGVMPVPVSKSGEGTLVFGPQNPLYIPIEHSLGVIRSADAGLSGVADALSYVNALEGAGAFETAAYIGPEVSGAAADALAQSGGDISRAALTRYLPAALEAYEASQEVDPGEMTRTGLPALDEDQRALWTSYLYADLADPLGQYGLKAGINRVLEPQVVTPPPDLAVPVEGFEAFWSEEPRNGLPFIYVGQEPSTGAHLWQSFEIGPRGKRNLEALRAATPEMFAEAFGLPGAILAGESQRVQAGPVYPVTGTTGALAELLGTVAPPPAAVRQEAARAISEARGAEQAPAQ
jgi:hypothetical protein